MTATENCVEIDARVIALDRTLDYQIEEQHKPAIARIMDVFLYDKNEHTHCSERIDFGGCLVPCQDEGVTKVLPLELMNVVEARHNRKFAE